MFLKCIYYTMHWDKTQMLKKFSLVKINGTNNALFFLSRAPTHTVLLVVCNFYMSWSTRFVSIKLCVGCSIFDFVSFWLKFIFLFNNNWLFELVSKLISESEKLVVKDGLSSWHYQMFYSFPLKKTIQILFSSYLCFLQKKSVKDFNFSLIVEKLFLDLRRHKQVQWFFFVF